MKALTRWKALSVMMVLVGTFAIAEESEFKEMNMIDKAPPKDKVEKSDREWRKILTKHQYAVARKGGTERAGTGELLHNKKRGVYECVCCGRDLFSSKTKYNSGSGWPSFYEPIDTGAVTEISDFTHGMVRVEVRCGRCDAHLGHVFEDGPQPTGLRYCINSASLSFVEDTTKIEAKDSVGDAR